MRRLVVKFHKDFDRQFAKLSKEYRDEVIEVIDLFLDNPREKSLRNHALRGKWLGYRSISVDGDLRLHFKVNEGMVVFVAVGGHSQLYK